MLITIMAVQTVNLTRLAKTQYYLTMDRTNWKWGKKKDINVLFWGC